MATHNGEQMRARRSGTEKGRDRGFRTRTNKLLCEERKEGKKTRKKRRSYSSTRQDKTREKMQDKPARARQTSCCVSKEREERRRKEEPVLVSEIGWLRPGRHMNPKKEWKPSNFQTMQKNWLKKSIEWKK